jgi:hypothetical protein
MLMRHASLLFVAIAVAALTASAATAPEIALGHIAAQRTSLGLSDSDVRAVIVSDHYKSAHNGVTHVYLRQQLNGVDVYGAVANVNVASDGTVLSSGSDLVANLTANRTTPVLTAAQAVSAAASALGLSLTAPLTVVETKEDETLLSKGGIALSPIRARLIYQPVGSVGRLAWNVEIEEISQQHWWSVRIDAETGALLSKEDYVDYDGSSYRAFAIPVESPSHGPRTLIQQPADAQASPYGWHDTNGIAGPEYTITRGNNAHAYADTIPEGMPDPMSEPDGGTGLDFDPAMDTTQEPLFYRDAAVTNLFYMNNVIHDVFYRYGFTEEAGNFQTNNYGRGGAGNDYVQAEAQDGTPNGANPPLNNANFATPVDGSRPRMQMYLWQPPYPNKVTVNAPSPAAGTFDATEAQFGLPVPPIGITGLVVLANDGVGVGADACTALIGFPIGSIALIERGGCTFATKVAMAEQAGAVAAILHNNVPGGPALRMGLTTTVPPDTNIALAHIPSAMVSYDDGYRMRTNLPLTANLARKTEMDRLRDGDFDNGIIAHEYGHGISNRLTGGRLNVSCLNNQEQMGEGWSDFLGLVLTARAGDRGNQNRGVGSYALYQPATGFGIRPTPYTTDLTGNPSTYDTIKTAAVPHGVGYVWASMLWEVYWNLVDAHGFNPDVYGPWSSGGNNLAIEAAEVQPWVRRRTGCHSARRSHSHRRREPVPDLESVRQARSWIQRAAGDLRQRDRRRAGVRRPGVLSCRNRRAARQPHRLAEVEQHDDADLADPERRWCGRTRSELDDHGDARRLRIALGSRVGERSLRERGHVRWTGLCSRRVLPLHRTRGSGLAQRKAVHLQQRRGAAGGRSTARAAGDVRLPGLQRKSER